MLFAAAGHAIDTGDYRLRMVLAPAPLPRPPGGCGYDAAHRPSRGGAALPGGTRPGASALSRPAPRHSAITSAGPRRPSASARAGIALEALDRVPAQWRDTAAYHELLAGASAADGQLQAADDNFAAAAQLDPKNPEHLVNLTTLRLTSATDDTLRQSARDPLERLAPFSPLPATRALLADALRQHDPARIARFRAAMLGQAWPHP